MESYVIKTSCLYGVASRISQVATTRKLPTAHAAHPTEPRIQYV